MYVCVPLHTAPAGSLRVCWPLRGGAVLLSVDLFALLRWSAVSCWPCRASQHVPCCLSWGMLIVYIWAGLLARVCAGSAGPCHCLHMACDMEGQHSARVLGLLVPGHAARRERLYMAGCVCTVVSYVWRVSFLFVIGSSCHRVLRRGAPASCSCQQSVHGTQLAQGVELLSLQDMPSLAPCMAWLPMLHGLLSWSSLRRMAWYGLPLAGTTSTQQHMAYLPAPRAFEYSSSSSCSAKGAPAGAAFCRGACSRTG